MTNADSGNKLPLPEDSEALRAFANLIVEARSAPATSRSPSMPRRRTESLGGGAAPENGAVASRDPALASRVRTLQEVVLWARADRLRTAGELAQRLLQFDEELDRKPVPMEDREPSKEPDVEPRRVQQRKGRRDLPRFENLPVTTHVYTLSEAERACPGCGQQRKEIGAEESWQVEYIPGRFERLQHVRKKYACPHCERQGKLPQIKTVIVVLGSRQALLLPPLRR